MYDYLKVKILILGKEFKDGMLGKYPGKTINRLAAALWGIWIGNIALNLVWEKPDQIDNKVYRQNNYGRILIDIKGRHS